MGIWTRKQTRKQFLIVLNWYYSFLIWELERFWFELESWWYFISSQLLFLNKKGKTTNRYYLHNLSSLKVLKFLLF